MYKFYLIYFFATLLSIQPLFSQNDNLNISVGTAFNSKNTLGFYNSLRTQNKSNINVNLEYSKKSLSSQYSFHFDADDNFNFDNSYIDYNKGITKLNIAVESFASVPPLLFVNANLNEPEAIV